MGNNMFAYCNDSPVNCTDSTGNRPVGIGESNKFNYYVNTADDGEDLEFPQLDSPLYYRPQHSGPSEGTLAVGLSGQLFGGPGGAVSGFVATDTNGDVGFMYSWGPGGGLPSYGSAFFVSCTNAPSVRNLLGRSHVVGGGMNICGVSIGLDYFMFNDEVNPSITYQGWSFAIGAAAEYPVESHGYVSFTDGIVIALWDD